MGDARGDLTSDVFSAENDLDLLDDCFDVCSF